MEDNRRVLVVGTSSNTELTERVIREAALTKRLGTEIVVLDDSKRKPLNFPEAEVYKIQAREIMEDTDLLRYDHSPLTKAQQGQVVVPVRNSSKDPKVGRNELCPCGSSMKYKNCYSKNKQH